MRYLECCMFFVMFQINTYAQLCNVPFTPSNTCESAPYICALDGYCSSNQGATNSGTPDAFCGFVENDTWIKWIAESTSLEIKINVSNCMVGSGLQAQAFSTVDCINFIAVSNCLDPIPNNTSANLLAENLIIGETYYLLMDGKGNDVCDYDYELISGEIFTPVTVTIDPVSLLCENGTLDINAVATSPNSNFTYEWTTTNGNIISDASSNPITVDQIGIYEVLATDDSGCAASAAGEVIAIERPDISFDPTMPLDCIDNATEVIQVNVEGGNQNFDFSWSTINGNILSGQNTSNPEVSVAGEYIVSITDQTTGCIYMASTEVLSLNSPIAVTTSGGELNCITSEISLNGSGSSVGQNFVAEWTTSDGNFLNGANTLSPLVNSAGTYELTITNLISGCTSTSTSIVTLNEEEPTGANILLGHPCFEKINGIIEVNSVIGGIAPFTYSFDGENFSSGKTIEFLPPNTYPIIIKDKTGCHWDTLITIESHPELKVKLGPDQEVILGCEVELKAQVNATFEQLDEINWTPDTTCTRCLETLLTPLFEQTYSIHIVDENGCEASDEVSFFVKKERNIFIPNAFSPNGDGINDVFMIYGGKDVLEIKTFRIFDRWGEMVMEHNNFIPNELTHSWDGNLKGKPLKESIFIYFVEVLFLDGRIELFKGDVVLMR